MTPNQSVLPWHTGMQEYVYYNTKSKHWDEYITIVRKVELKLIVKTESKG